MAVTLAGRRRSTDRKRVSRPNDESKMAQGASRRTQTGDYFRCTGAVNSGTCSNNRGTSIETLEKIIVDAVKETLCDPIRIARFAEVFRRDVEMRMGQLRTESVDA